MSVLPNYVNITSNATTVVLNRPGIIHSVTINTKGAGSNTATIYDNASAGSGTKIATIDTTTALGTLFYDVRCNNGITIVTANGSPPDITVSLG